MVALRQAGRSIVGPGEDLGQSRATTAEVALGEQALQASLAGGTDRWGRTGEARQRHGGSALPELEEALGVAGHGGVQQLADLAAQDGVLVDQVAALPDQKLQV